MTIETSERVPTPTSAEADLREIARWYQGHRGQKSARKVVRDIRAQLEQLVRNSEMGRIEEDLASRDHLLWPYRF